ncbi:MAG: helix-turn-helix transcriptional regulator [Oscillospiraceae bacterium]|nr:helix-turn-helix transcriptional regulator [Oscillospiraceae bacterium]
MQLSLSENIRLYRKQRKLTQEKLAEALGVTVGAVYKWESGQSLPELNLLVEMADFFDISVDVLLGYRVKDNRLDAALERLESYCVSMDPTALSEAEKTLGKYPHSFRAVYGCAMVYMAFGVSTRDRVRLRRSVELFEQSRALLPQNEDPRISDSTICGNLSMVWLLLGEQEKSVEFWKKNNAGGVFSSEIGFCLAVFMNRQNEAAAFLSEAFLNGLSNLLTTMFGCVFVFRSRGDWKSALDITKWGIDLLTGLKTEAKPDFLEKTYGEMLIVLAYLQFKAGMKSESADTLIQARDVARRFDSMPEYTMNGMRFADQAERRVVFDIFGATAASGIECLLGLLDDPVFTGQWKEISEHGN